MYAQGIDESFVSELLILNCERSVDPIEQSIKC